METSDITRHVLIVLNLYQYGSILVETPKDRDTDESIRIHIMSGRKRIFELFPEEFDLLFADDIVELDSGCDDPDLHYATEVYIMTESAEERLKHIAKKIRKNKRPP